VKLKYNGRRNKMRIIITCNCGNDDFIISEWYKYARCTKCGESVYIKDSEFNVAFEELKKEMVK
jgi:hypothetical protein